PTAAARASSFGESRANRVEALVPDLCGDWRDDAVPDRREAPDQLGDPRGPSHEPPMQVLRAVAPAADVHAADLADAPDRALDSGEQDAALGSKGVRKVPRLGVMLTRFENQDDREAGRPDRPQPPPLVRPQELVVGLLAGATLHAALAVPRLLSPDRRLKRPRPHVAVEWKRFPFVDGWHAEVVRHAFMELFWRLGHCRGDANVAPWSGPSRSTPAAGGKEVGGPPRGGPRRRRAERAGQKTKTPMADPTGAGG